MASSILYTTSVGEETQARGVATAESSLAEKVQRGLEAAEEAIAR